ELTVPPALHVLGAEHGPEVVPAGDRLACADGVLDVRARRARGSLRAEGERRPAGVEGEHLLLDDVGRLAHGADEQLRRRGQRRADLAVAVALYRGAKRRLQPLPPPDLVGEDVVHPLGGAVLHGSGGEAPRGSWLIAWRARKDEEPCAYAQCARSGQALLPV